MSNTTSVGGTSDADSYRVVGTGGTGYVEIPSQSAGPGAAAAGSVRLYADSAGDFAIIDDAVNSIAFNLAGITASRKYGMPDANGDLVGTNAAQTLTNKTIMSAGGNIVDATSINGFSIAGTPGSGQYLRYNGSAWSPQTIAGAAPLSFDGASMSLQVGSVGGVASFTDARFTTPQIINVRTGTVGYGEFSSVAAAIASVTDATTLKRYVIYVGAGVFVEPAFSMKPYVYLRGFNKLATVIRPSTPGTTLITATSNSSVEECMLLGLGSGIGLLVDNCVSSYFGNLTIMNFHTCMKFTATASMCDTLLHEFLYYSPCTYGIWVDGRTSTSVGAINVSLSMGRFRGDAGVVQGLRFEGPHAKVSANSIRSVSCDTGVGCYIDDTANVEFGNSKITNCLNGLIVGNVGGAPFLVVRDTLFLNNVVDVSMNHPGATGLINGVARKSKITINPTSSIAVSYVDLDSNANIITGEFYYSPANDSVLTETGSLIVNGAPVGCYEGGAVSDGGGLTANVDAGLGYIVATTGSGVAYMLKVTWDAASIGVNDNVDNYIYVDSGGLHFAATVPSQTTNILLSRVKTRDGSIEFIDGQLQSNLHPSTRNIIAKRETGGPIYASGSTVTVNGSNQIDVTAGVYYYLNNRFEPAGGTPVKYSAYWRDGGGDWKVVSENVIQAVWDDGSGSLAPIPSGQWARHLLYLVSGGVSDERYLFVYGQALFASETAAANDSITLPPTYFDEGVTAIASFTINDVPTITPRDLRAVRGPTGNGVIATVVSHGALTGLTADDHLQYLLVDGSRAMGGTLQLGGNAVTGASTYNGVTITAHAARHLPNGLDPLTTAAPLSSLTSLSTNGVGTANSFARSDHSHAIDITGFGINTLSGTLGVAKGGTGVATLTSNGVLVGNGTGAVTSSKLAPSGVFVGTTDAQTLTNKTLQASTTSIIGTAGGTGTGTVRFVANGASSTTFITAAAAAISVTVPSITDTLVGRTTTDTLTGKTLIGGASGNDVSANSVRGVAVSATAPTAGQALVASSGTTAAWGGLSSITGTLGVGSGGTGLTTLTNNRVLVGAGAALDLTKTAPTGAFVGTTDTQALSNKTLAAASTLIESGGGNTIAFVPTGITTIATSGAATLTLPSGTRTLVGQDTVDTLTGKTITDPSNTVAAGLIRYSGGTVATGAASAPTAGQVLTAINATTAAWQDPVAGTTFLDTTFAVVDNTDVTRQVRFDVAGTTGTVTTIVTQQTANASITLPAATDTLVGRSTVDTLSNKTLTAPVIATIVNSGTLTLPTSTDTLVGRATTDTLSNKTLAAASTLISGSGGLAFAAGGTSTTTLASSPSAPNTLTLPTSTDTLVGRTTTDTLGNKTLVMETTSVVDTSLRSYLFTATGSASTACTITSAMTASRVIALPDISDTLVTKTSTDTLSNKSITGGTAGNTVSADLLRAVAVSAVAPTVGQVLVATTTTAAAWGSVPLSGVTGVLSVANGGTGVSNLTSGRVLIGNGGGAVNLAKAAPVGNFVGTTDAQTLSGKTLTAPTIATIVNVGTLTLPTSTDTLVGRSTTDALSNKTLSYTTSTIDVNTITGIVVSGVPVQGNGIYMSGTPGSAVWGSLDLGEAAATTGVLAVARGGTGAATLTSGNLLTGNGAGAIQSTTPIPAGGLVGASAAQTLSNKTLAGASTIIGGTLITDTLTFNVTGSNTIVCSGGTSTMPSGFHTIVGRDSIDTMTFKTLVDGSNNIMANRLRVIGGNVDISATLAPTVGQVLTATSPSSAEWQNVTVSGVFSDGAFQIFRAGDPTNTLSFALLGSTGTFTQIVANQTGNIQLQLPGTADTLVGRDTTDTLSNKTLVTPAISSILNSGTLTLPTGTDTLVGRATTDTLTGKTIVSTTNTVAAQRIHYSGGTVDVSASAAPSVGQVLVASSATTASWADVSIGIVSGTLAVANGGTGVTTITAGNVLVGNGASPITATKAAPAGAFVGTTDTQTLSGKTLTAPVIATIVNTGTLTLPTSTDTLVGRATTDTLSNKTLTAPVIATIVNGGTLTLPTTTTTLVGRTTTDTLTNKTLTAPIISTIVNTGTLTLPTTTDTLVGRATTDTLSNKTLTAPNISTIVNTGTLTLPTTTDTLVGRATTDTLTGKTIVSTTNTVAAQQLHNATGVVSVSASAAPTAGQVLVASNATTATWAAVPASGLAGTVPVANGGTGATSLTSGNVLVGNGTGAVVATQAAPTGDFVGTTDSQTLLNKTLTLPAISTIVNGGSLTLPSGTDTIVARGTTDTLTNKTIISTTNTVAAQRLHNATGLVDISASAAPTAGQVLVAINASTAAWSGVSVSTATGVLPVTNGGTGATSLTSGNVLVGAGVGAVTTTKAAPTGAFVGTTDTQTLTNKTLAAPIMSTIVNTGTLSLPTSTDTLVGRATTDTLTNKTLTAPTIATIVNVGTLSLPTSTDTLVGRATTDTLTNKTLTAPTIATIVNVGTLSLPTSTDTLVGRATTDTLTGKTIVSTTNTVAAQQLHNATGVVDVSASTAPTAGQALVASNATTAAWTSLPRPMVAFNFYITTTSTTYVNVSGNNVLSSYLYPGTTITGGTITRFMFVASLAAASSYDVRLQDVTNNLTIATVTPVATVAATVYSTTTIANVPAGPAQLQIQAIRIGAIQAIAIRGWTIVF